MLLENPTPIKPQTTEGDDGRFAFPPEWLSYPAAVHYCGLSRVTLWRLVGSGEIEAARVGRAVRISRASLEAFMHSKVGA